MRVFQLAEPGLGIAPFVGGRHPVGGCSFVIGIAVVFVYHYQVGSLASVAALAAVVGIGCSLF